MLQGKVAIVTGGGTGIGAATARIMAREGARLVLSGRAGDPLDAIADEIRAGGGEAVAIPCDIAEEDEIAALVAGAIAAFGRIDVLHANAALTDGAAMAQDGLITAMDAAVWDRAMTVNLRGPMLCVKHVVPHMIAGGGGSIVFTSSGKGTQGDLDFPAYGASKAGLNMLSRYVAAQFGKQGIRANTVIVGIALTDTLKASFPEQARRVLEEHHLTPYLAEPGDIGEVVAFLASDRAAFITGAEIAADGGVTSHSALLADFRRMHAAAAGG